MPISDWMNRLRHPGASTLAARSQETLRTACKKIEAITEPQPISRKVEVRTSDGAKREIEVYQVRLPDGRTVPISEEQIRRTDADSAYIAWKPDAPVLQRIPLSDFVSTAGDLASPVRVRGAFVGGIQAGYSSGFPSHNPMQWAPVMVGGIFGGLAGIRQGEKTNSLERGLEAGACVGAASSAAALAFSAAAAPLLGPAAPAIPLVLAALLLSSRLLHHKSLSQNKIIGPVVEKARNLAEKIDKKLHGHLPAAASSVLLAGALALEPHLALPILYTAFMGGMGGAIGTYSGNQLSSVRDRDYTGYLLGVLGKSFLPINPMASGISAPLARNAKSTVKKIAASFLPAFTLGAASGLILGPHVALLCGLASGAFSVAGNLFGQRFMQLVRNVNTNGIGKLLGKIDKPGRKIGKKERVASAALAGALMFGLYAIPAGILFGPFGAVIPPLAGAIYFGGKNYAFQRKAENEKQAA